jgi:hypothetical protein
MTFLIVVLILVILTYAYNLYNIEKHKHNKLREIEIQFLLGSMHFLQYKYHVLQILEIVHEKAAESDPKFIEDYKIIKEKIEEKYNQFGDEWIKSLKDTLGYETEYKNWYEATKYIDGLVKRSKERNNSTE